MPPWMQGKWRRRRDPWQGFVGRWPEPIRGDSTAADPVPRPTTCDSGRCERNLRVGGPQDNRGGAQLVHKLHRECGVRGGRLRSRSAKRTAKRWASCAYFTQDTGASVSRMAAPEEVCQHNKHHAQPGGAGQSARQHSEDSSPMPLQILSEKPAVSLGRSLDLVGPPTRILADLQAILQDADNLVCVTAHIQHTLQSFHGQLGMSIVHGT